ncbi:type II secretion system protein GspC [Alteromonas gilva]|uniref:Type II secretion system protein GspC n=1 Tax=Alteromonas gilva TaxID=2987522 RepID=A0ABT5KX59_9ALTE|nr:type II secretion system protein GspC [Alteromonas gilva]MDC8829350.1 type II secretion system protein GspC [Alteromonas gilva]
MILSQTKSLNVPAFFTAHQSRIRFAVIVLLCLYLIAYAADITWKLIPTPASDSTAAAPGSSVTASAGSSSGSQRGVDINQLQRLNLFGEVNKVATPQPVEETITDAPETNLNLVLSGVVSTSSKDAGTAVIENRGKQAIYAVGDKIDATNATLSQVHSDRVIIKNGGRHETLMLQGLDFTKRRARPPVIAATGNRSTAMSPARDDEEPVEMSDDAIAATEALRNKPGSFTDYITITPALEGGSMAGYKVQPGKDPSLFNSVGLQNGDIVIQINGLDLTDPSQAQEAMSELRNAQSIELTVTRNGEYTSLYLDMPEQ